MNQLLRWYYKPSAETKKTWQYRVFNFISSTLPLLGIVVAAHVAYKIKEKDHFNSTSFVHDYYAKGLKTVGEVPAGISILRTPHFRHPMGQFFIDTIPITLICFMESYSIARRIAAANGQSNLLSASQEMIANGAANLMGCISSSFPVSGSFSRSALVSTALVCMYVCLVK
jgi:MFS superfamily sulfate permease-like transporter